MGEENPRLVVRIDTKNPIELRDFVGAFIGIGNQFEVQYAREHGVSKGTARFFVHEVREGSIIAELVPYFFRRA
ncbi:hypothetical protein EH31_06955 [Erythrobacter longus]|uniref:Uncharacterized protein n=1 Tax=Erythrobacter longus TaxID=1044 RepID=A0A074MDE3_ERYLO|nr:hypothetical protein EH31_06955 [Erythrobacter longus]